MAKYHQQLSDLSIRLAALDLQEEDDAAIEAGIVKIENRIEEIEDEVAGPDDEDEDENDDVTEEI